MLSHDVVLQFIGYCHLPEHEDMLIEELVAEFIHQYAAGVDADELIEAFEGEMGY
jgi:hypothetical protein